MMTTQLENKQLFDFIPKYDPTIEKCGLPREEELTVTGIRIGRGETSAIVDPDTVYKLALMGATNVEIAEWYGVTEQSIRYRFSEYLAKARSSLKIKLRRAQLKVAIENENPTMLIWLGRNMLGQSENVVGSESEKVLPWLTEEESADNDALN
jgi:hypothetical protein